MGIREICLQFQTSLRYFSFNFAVWKVIDKDSTSDKYLHWRRVKEDVFGKSIPSNANSVHLTHSEYNNRLGCMCVCVSWMSSSDLYGLMYVCKGERVQDCKVLNEGSKATRETSKWKNKPGTRGSASNGVLCG